MTKKSAARLERDKEAADNKKAYTHAKETNKCWDELKGLANKCADMMITTNVQLAEIYKTENIALFLDNPDEVKTVLRGLAGDLTTFREDLARIYNAHSSRSGGFTNEDDFAVSISIFENYHAFQTKYDAVISPSVHYLLEQAGIAEEKIKQRYLALQEEKQAEVELLDPTVVSDAVVKS